jgi:hypothetical protein
MPQKEGRSVPKRTHSVRYQSSHQGAWLLRHETAGNGKSTLEAGEGMARLTKVLAAARDGHVGRAAAGGGRGDA